MVSSLAFKILLQKLNGLFWVWCIGDFQPLLDIQIKTWGRFIVYNVAVIVIVVQWVVWLGMLGIKSHFYLLFSFLLMGTECRWRGKHFVVIHWSSCLLAQARPILDAAGIWKVTQHMTDSLLSLFPSLLLPRLTHINKTKQL